MTKPKLKLSGEKPCFYRYTQSEKKRYAETLGVRINFVQEFSINTCMATTQLRSLINYNLKLC